MMDQLNIQSISRLIQEEKQTTEARAEELESRVGSLEHMNLLARGRSLERQSPPLSGRSTPNSPNRDYLHKYHTVRIHIYPISSYFLICCCVQFFSSCNYTLMFLLHKIHDYYFYFQNIFISLYITILFDLILI